MIRPAVSISLICLTLFVFLSTPVYAVLPGARSSTSSGDVFLGGDYIELGISKYGSFGTDASKPASFFGTAARTNIGMSSDLDGFDTGTDWRMDFFMPGTQEERWSIGYKIGGIATTASNARRANTTDITDNIVTDESSGENLKATGVGSYNSKLQITQVVTFSKSDKFFKTAVTLKNISASDTLDSVRFMRSFDPDNTVDKGGGYITHNKIVSTHLAGDGKAVVSADTSSSDTDPVYTGTGGASGGTRSPIFFYSTDTRARVSYHPSLNPGTVYTAAVYDSVPAKNSQENRDGAIAIIFDVGTVEPGSSASFNYYTSLDERDFAVVEEQIIQKEAEAAPLITGLVATPSATSAIISWQTNATASSQVEYGLVPEYGFLTAITDTATRVLNHEVTLTNLKQCARYFYFSKSLNGSDLSAVSAQGTFTTTGCAVSTISGGSEADIATGGGQLTYTSGASNARLVVPSDFYTATATTSFQINRLAISGVTPPADKGFVAENLYDLIAVSENDEQISNFDNPVTFTVNYTHESVVDYDETSLDLYKYSNGEWIKKNCTLDTTLNTLTCVLPGFSVYGVFGQLTGTTPTPTPTPAPAVIVTTTTSPAGPETCNAVPPVSSPNLFQIDTTKNSAKLYFTPISNTNQYYVSYSTSTSAEEHGVIVDLGSEGVQSYEIGLLAQNTTYYFKVRGQKDCMPGPWSNIKGINTLGVAAQQRQNPTLLSSILEPSMEITEIKTENLLPATCNYTVQSGDTLWKIAKTKYNDGSLFKEIIKNNLDNFPKIAKGLKTGWELKLACKVEDAKISQTKSSVTDDVTTYDVLVKVINKGVPLAGVAVELPDAKYGITDENGNVLFKSVTRGEQLIKLVHSAYAAEQKIVVDGPNREFNVSITVEMKEQALSIPWWIWLIISVLLFIVIILWKKTRKRNDSNKS
jgi:LysM repeat protein